ncbi:MAG: RIP metalloprotease RseP [Lachnospiraceae bacterium]|nr:RIP metalloprotease RseP [Lachnospiraceae bacterium]
MSELSTVTHFHGAGVSVKQNIYCSGHRTSQLLNKKSIGGIIVSIISIIIFLIILGVLVMVHELGHFIVAKLNGIRVLEFCLGMGPQLIKFKKGETVYSIRLFPIGGACMFDGEDGNVEGGGPGDEHCFNNAGVWARIGTVVAGPLCNFILAFIFSFIIVNFSATDLPIVVSVTEGYPAAEAGLLPGDEIVSINGEKVHLYREVQVISQLNQGDPYELVVRRGDELIDISFSPLYVEEEGRYYMGLTGGEYVQVKGLDALKYGFYEVRYATVSTYKSLLMMIKGQVKTDDMAGVVGIANMVGETYEAVKPAGLGPVVLTMMNLASILSVNLGIVNLLPLPALDGGRLVFLLVELVRGKPVPPEKEGLVHTIGFVFFMVLMVFLVFNDIRNIFF